MGGLLDIGFTRFLSLSLISVWWVIALVLIGIVALIIFIVGIVWLVTGAASGLLLMVGAVIGAVVCAVITRLSLESVAVLFRIVNNTSEIAEATRSRRP